MFRDQLPRVSYAFFITLFGTGMITIADAQSAQQAPRASAKLVATLGGHMKDIIALSFSPDGERIATGSEDGTVRLWNGRTGQLMATLNIKKKARTMRLAWSPDARSLAVKHNYGGEKIQIWDVQTARLKATLGSQHYEAPFGLAWSPDAKALLTTDYHGTAKLWDAESGRMRATFPQDPPCPKKSFIRSILAIDRCPEPGWVEGYFVAEKRVLTFSGSHSPRLWDASGRLERDLPLPRDEPEPDDIRYWPDAVISPNRQLIARRGQNRVALLEASTGQVEQLLGDIGDTSEPLSFSPDGRKLLVLRRKSKIGLPCFQVRCDLQIYDVAGGQLQRTFKNMSADSKHYWSPDGAVIVTVSGLILDTRTGRVLDLPYHACTSDRLIGDPECDPFIFSADGRIALKLKNPLKLWDRETGELLIRLDIARSPAAFSPTHAHLLITRGMYKKTALVWEILR